MIRAVEYINGIEVIKAFAKAQKPYLEKFAVVAAREGASCYVEWMRRCNIYFCLAMSIFPATMVAVLPIGGLLFRAGTLDANTFIQVIFLRWFDRIPDHRYVLRRRSGKAEYHHRRSDRNF